MLLAQGSTKPVKVNDIVKTTATGFTLLGAVLTGVYAYRKQRLSEGDAKREDARHLAERYTAAAEQLGHEKAAVRLAGVYAMARLADDWPEQRQVCIDVLCAYIRMPYQPDPDSSDDSKAGEREVRLTIIRIISDHLQDSEASASWCGYDLDFAGATFDGGEFIGATFTGGVNFDGAQFAGGTVDFTFAEFDGGVVNFHGAQFTGGTVDFGADFNDCIVSFDGAQFTGGTVNFDGARIVNGIVDFDSAEWTEGIATVSFEHITIGDTARVVWGPFHGDRS